MTRSLFFFTSAALLITTLGFFSGHQFAHTARAALLSPMTGWAWSDTIGWVSLNGSGYGVSVNTDLTVVGYAWSDNIGWVRFGGLSGFPGGVPSNTNATFVGNALVGWARACAGTVANDCVSASRADGWDGWIYLGNTGHGDGVTASPSGPLSGFAWGSDVVGWLDFSFASANVVPPCAAAVGNQCASPTMSRYTDAFCAVTDTNCPFGCQASSGVCYAAPQPASGCLSIGDLASCRDVVTVRPGSVRLFWNIALANSCTLTGSGGEGGPSAGPGWNSIAQVTGFAAPVTARTLFTLTCVSNDGSTFTDSVTVNITPTYVEPPGIF